MSNRLPESSAAAQRAGRSWSQADDDRDILAGISVMVLAIANRQNLADQDVPPRPCSEPHPDKPNLYCVAAVGHDGDHLYDELGDLDGLAPPPSRGMN